MSTFSYDMECVAAVMKETVNIRFWVLEKYVDRDCPIEFLDLSPRAVNGLKRDGLFTIGSVYDRWDELYKVKGIGIASIGQIKRSFIERYYDKLSLKQRQEFWARTIALTEGTT